jgi:hypothetical protein
MTEHIHHQVGLIYVTVNALRILFYWPQIQAVARCQHGAASNSLTTWGYFCASHWVAVVYFIYGQPDRFALLISLGNALAVFVLLVTIVWKRKLRRV